MTGRASGATAKEFGDYVMGVVAERDLESRWDKYVHG